jgi:hypothetical protein
MDVVATIGAGEAWIIEGGTPAGDDAERFAF